MAAISTTKASGLDIFVDMYKLNSEIDPDGIQTVHKSVTSDLARGLRRIERIERWTRERQIGRGGFGVVYLQRNTSGEVRAVKVLDKQLNASQKQNFLRELMHMAYFSKDQACFPTFHGWYEDNEKMYLAMEYFQFGDLKACLSHDISASLPELEVRMIISQVAEALAMLHAKGISHRDLKPTNVFVYRKGPNWWVKLGDFGISKRVQGDDTGLYTRILGPFVAPEVNDFFPHDDEETGLYTSAVDIWSLGCLAHWLLTRQTPFQERGSLHNYCTSKIELPLGLLPTLTSTAGCDFFRHCLAVQPKDRFTAQEALESAWLRNVSEGGTDAPLSNPNAEPVAAASVPLPYRQATQDLRTKHDLMKVSSSVISVENELGLDSAGDTFPKLSPRVPQPTIPRNGQSLKDKQNPYASGRVVDKPPSSATDTTSSRLDKKESMENNLTILDKSSSKRPASLIEKMSTPTTTWFKKKQALRALSSTGMQLDSRGTLIWAAEHGHFYLIHHILSHGLATNFDDLSSKAPHWTALQSLAQRKEKGSVEAAEALLEAGADPDPSTGTMTPLMIAAESGNLEMAQLLIRWEVDVNHTGGHSSGQSPIFLAISGNSEDIAKLLLKSGASVELHDASGKTPLMWAAEKGSTTMSKMLLSHQAIIASIAARQSSLMRAIMIGHESTVEPLDDQATSSHEKSAALNLAAYNGHVSVVSMLLDEGADVNSQAPDSGQTALHRAAAGGRSSVVQLLLERGANSLIHDVDGLYPMDVVKKGPARQQLLLSLI